MLVLWMNFCPAKSFNFVKPFRIGKMSEAVEMGHYHTSSGGKGALVYR